MIQLGNSAAQTIQPGQVVTFDRVSHHSGCAECYRQGTNSVKLRANGVYKVEFSGNISSATAETPVQLAIALGGIPLSETVMESTPAVANAYNSVSTGTYIRNCCGDFDRVTVMNTGTNPVLLSANMNLRIGRRS